jgi:hypothetical protein
LIRKIIVSLPYFCEHAKLLDRTEQCNRDKTTIAGQPGEDSWGRIVGIGQLGHYNLDRTTMAGQSEQGS